MISKPNREIAISDLIVAEDSPTIFIADIAANHDGDLVRAKDLIYLAKSAGAQIAKFQHFCADTIVSDHGFKSLGTRQSHQSGWKKSVFEVYADASLNPDWTPLLKAECDRAGLVFMTSPYAIDLVDLVDPFVSAYKVGSGDLTWPGIIDYMARKGKPLLLATGASTADEVTCAVETVLAVNPRLVLMQCNTNYTGSRDNFRHVHLNVLRTFRAQYPDLPLGFSDHTPGHAAVLGAVALGARVVEKHFTDDNGRIGPDHGFALNPTAWREMVERTRELEDALGSGVKRVADNEQETVVLQRRAWRARRDLAAGTLLSEQDLSPLRPCPIGALPPSVPVFGRKLSQSITEGEPLTWRHLASL